MDKLAVNVSEAHNVSNNKTNILPQVCHARGAPYH